MQTISITLAKAQWIELIARVAAGEDFIITKRGKPMAKLTAADAEEPERATLSADAL